jgi:hypothetical protein
VSVYTSKAGCLGVWGDFQEKVIEVIFKVEELRKKYNVLFLNLTFNNFGQNFSSKEVLQ